MKYRRTLLTLAILGPMAAALSLGATKPAHANDYDWCRYYNHYNDPRCAHPYGYPYPYGGFFFGDGRRFHHHFDHGGGFNHGGGMFAPGGGGHRR
jgi:hypothetical protein